MKSKDTPNPLKSESAMLREQQRRRVPKGFLAVTALIAALPLGIAAVKNRDDAAQRAASHKVVYKFPFQELADLDRSIQLRFAVLPVHDDFGMRRMGIPGHSDFYPTTHDEKGVMARLKNGGWNVMFYVAGRPMHRFGDRRGSPVSMPVKSFLMTPVRVFEKPAAATTAPVVTPTPAINWPNEMQLRPIATTALKTFKTSGGYDTFVNGIQVTAVPINASRQECVDCHHSRGDTSLKLGDPIGAAIYAYQQTPAATTAPTGK